MKQFQNHVLFLLFWFITYNLNKILCRFLVLMSQNANNSKGHGNLCKGDAYICENSNIRKPVSSTVPRGTCASPALEHKTLFLAIFHSPRREHGDQHRSQTTAKTRQSHYCGTHSVSRFPESIRRLSEDRWREKARMTV